MSFMVRETATGRGGEQLVNMTDRYLTLFIFAHMFLVILCYDALRLKNTIQVIGICIFNVAMLVYAAIQQQQIKEANDTLALLQNGNIDIWPNIKPFLITIPCVIAFCSVLMSVVCWKLYDEFAWRIYKHISADLRMKKRYLTFQVCSPSTELYPEKDN